MTPQHAGSHAAAKLLSNHPAAFYWISYVMTFLSPTYQCSHCRCRRRSGGLSFPCHLPRRGLSHPAGAFELEGRNFISKTQPLIILTSHHSQGFLLLRLTVHTCVDVIAVRRFPQSFHSCEDKTFKVCKYCFMVGWTGLVCTASEQ